MPVLLAKIVTNRHMTSTHKRPPDTAALPLDSKARVVARTALAGFLALSALWMAQDFLAPLCWAVVIAVSAWPLYLRFAEMFSQKRRDLLAPLTFTLIVGIFIFFPVGLALHRAAQEGQAVADSLARYRETGVPIPSWLGDIPGIGEHASRWWRVNLSDAKVAHQWIGATDTKHNAEVTRAMGIEVLHRTFMFVVALITLFALLRHGPWIAGRVEETADRLLGNPGERLTSRMVAAIRGTVNGTVVVAITEGAVIGVAYVLAGVPHALLFTLLTMAFAMLPFGAWAVFSTASLLLALQGGSALVALGIFVFGAFVMILGDTLVWPAVVGSAARLPFVIALIGIFGGLQSFGLIGLFLGPITMAALMIVWREWLMNRPQGPRTKAKDA